jgi:hypothetical protein
VRPLVVEPADVFDDRGIEPLGSVLVDPMSIVHASVTGLGLDSRSVKIPPTIVHASP